MTEDMGRLLRDAGDDAGRPLGFALEELVVRGRRRVRVRRSSFAAVAGVAAAGLAASVLTAWPSGTDDSDGSRFATSDDEQLIERCARLDELASAASSTYPTPGEPIDHWTIQVRQADDEAISMILAPDGQREFAYCRLDLTGGHAFDAYWRRQYASYIGAPAGATRVGDGEVLWGSGGATSEKIGRMTFETADGEISEAARNGHYFVWQHQTADVEPGEPVWVTFYYAHDGSVADRMRTEPMPGPYDPAPELPDQPRADLPTLDEGVTPEGDAPADAPAPGGPAADAPAPDGPAADAPAPDYPKDCVAWVEPDSRTPTMECS
ncbi:MAG: hypothetical protein ACRDPQ_02370 [Nocardioidaceae bacterium]